MGPDRRRVCRAGSVALLAAAGALLGGCVVDASGEEARSTTAPTVATTVPLPYRAIERMVPADPPDGFAREPDGDAGAGPVDLREAVLEEGRGDSLAFFAGAGYVRGYQRRFVDGLRERRVDVWVHELERPEGAQALLLRSRADAPADALPLEADRVLGSTGWLERRPDEATAVLLFVAGNLVARIEVVDPDADVAADRATEVAELVDRLVPRSPAERAAGADIASVPPATGL